MLRASAEALHQRIDLRAVSDSVADPLLPGGRELRCLVDAVVLRDGEEREEAIGPLLEAVGVEGAVRAAAVIGNFEMMNRLLDGIGVGPFEGMTDIAPDLGISWPPEGSDPFESE